MYGKSNMETYIAATAKSLQSCPTLCDPIDVSLPGSPVPGIVQARTLKWFAIPFSSGPHFVGTLNHDPSILGGSTWPYGNVSFHVTLSIHLTLSSPLPMSISLFSMSVSPLLPCK